MPCFKPFYRAINDGYGNSRLYPCPCGHCPYCRYQQRRIWSFRLEVEKLYWHHSVFVTLTYDPVKWNRNTLSPSHLTNFWKRLRKTLGEHKIKYFACGEYSIRPGNNPHYHAIIYGLSKDDIHLIESHWNYGFVDCGDVTERSIKYVAGYVMKKLGKDKDRYKDSDAIPEFIRCSQGIGLEFLKDFPFFRSSVVWNGRTQYLGRYLMNKLAYIFYPYDDLKFRRNPVKQLALEDCFLHFSDMQLRHEKDYIDTYSLEKYLTDDEPYYFGEKDKSLLRFAYEKDTIQFKRDFLAKFKSLKRIQNEEVEIQSFASG